MEQKFSNSAAGESAGRAGRKRVTSAAELEHIAFELFTSRGFDRTTVNDIAAAAGIGRRTFFRYFPSKNDIAWGDFEGQLRQMRERLFASPPQRPLMEAIREALLDFNRVDTAELPWLRRRMELILTVPALQAHSTLRYAAWRQVLAEYIGHRMGLRDDSVAPQTIAYATLGVAIAAYEQWLRRDDTDLIHLLDTAMRELASAFSASNVAAPAQGPVAR
ncbi:MAG: regulatory protein TetR [Streptosporangiaceae bacterium]|jgi:mycofactocin system transcriptional regulator|nr:regulatory protein TetR [Streptosporangiaceae bacterium]